MSAIISSKQHILEASRNFGSDLELQALQCETDPCKQAFPSFFFFFTFLSFVKLSQLQHSHFLTQNTKNSNFFKENQNR